MNRVVHLEIPADDMERLKKSRLTMRTRRSNA